MAPHEADGPGQSSSHVDACGYGAVVNTTQPIASNAIGRRLKRNSRQLIETPAE